MPHQCIECGRTFPDGSKEMLSGCPDCGGNKFQFRPRNKAKSEKTAETEGSEPGSVKGNEPTTNEPVPNQPTTSEPTPDQPDRDDTESEPAREPPTTSDRDGSSPVTASSPSSTDRDSNEPKRKSGDSDTSNTATDAEQLRDDGTEDTAQASARSDVVTPDELDRASQDVAGPDPSEVDNETAPRPDVDELRHELNEQFESIRIVSPGQYELNLMELYDRQEYIISLQEDGRYVIEMPDAWGVSDE